MSISSQNTAPHHLYLILDRVRESEKANYASGWVAALDAEWGSVEFSRRHSEVAHLLLSTIEQLHALSGRARDRSLRYVPAWWTAVMQPQANWTDNQRPADKIISQDMMDHLDAAADIIAGSLVGSEAAPRSADLENMADQCREWVELLRSMADDELGGPIRDHLISQIEHLLWLIDNVTVFGGARVAGEASRVIGSLAQASATMTAGEETASRWRKGWMGFLAVCVAFNLGAPALQQSIESGSGLVKEITSVVSDMQGEG